MSPLIRHQSEFKAIFGAGFPLYFYHHHVSLILFGVGTCDVSREIVCPEQWSAYVCLVSRLFENVYKSSNYSSYEICVSESGGGQPGK